MCIYMYIYMCIDYIDIEWYRYRFVYQICVRFQMSTSHWFPGGHCQNHNQQSDFGMLSILIPSPPKRITPILAPFSDTEIVPESSPVQQPWVSHTQRCPYRYLLETNRLILGGAAEGITWYNHGYKPPLAPTKLSYSICSLISGTALPSKPTVIFTFTILHP